MFRNNRELSEVETPSVFFDKILFTCRFVKYCFILIFLPSSYYVEGQCAQLREQYKNFEFLF